MKRKYLEELKKLGAQENVFVCIPNANIPKNMKKAKHYIKQRRKFGFDERETWSMDTTLACWIYEHFKWYVEYAPIDMTFHKFDIEIISSFGENNTPEYQMITVDQKTAIEYVFEYLEYYLTKDDDIFSYFYYVCAMKIVAIIMPAMWW